MTPTDDQLREAASRWLKEQGVDAFVRVEANGTIFRTPEVSFITAVVAVGTGERDFEFWGQRASVFDRPRDGEVEG